MKKIFAVEATSTFYEVFLVEAESEEEAKFIASHSDANASKWLGQQFSIVDEFDEVNRKRFKQLDSYFFDGYASVDENGYLLYKDMTGEVHGTMPKEKIR